MKNTNVILNLLTAFLGILGCCSVILVCFILFIYPKLDSNSSNKDSASSVQNTVDTLENMPVVSSQIVLQPQTKEPIKSGTYTIDDIEFWFSDSVINDVTGRWKISSIASSKDITEYIADYYNTLFGSDDEIHAITNFSLNTTTSISVLPDGLLDVAVHEYVSGEEHDANTLFSGMLLAEYFINLSTGEIENILDNKENNQGNNETVIYEHEIENNFNTYNNAEQQNTADTYVLNADSKKIHHPNCNDVTKIAQENYSTSNLSISELEAQGYTTCGHCFR